MKDFSSYRSPAKDTLMWSSRKIFEYQLEDEGEDVLVDGVPTKAIIQTHTNPYNELKEDRKFLCSTDVVIKRGSIVDYNNKKWLVMNEVKTNQVYQYLKILVCTHSLTLYKNSITYQCPIAIESSVQLYRFNQENTKFFTELSDIIICRIQNNNITSLITIGDIYEIGKFRYKVTNISDVIEPGLLIVKLQITAEQPELIPDPIPNQPIEIIGIDSIVKGKLADFSTNYSGNVVFSIEGEFASILNQQNNSCTVRAGDTLGVVKLWAKTLDGLAEGYKEIRIRNIF